MAAPLIAGAAVGAVFGELLKAVLEIKERAVMFKQTLVSLQSTLIAIAPVIKEIEQHNDELGRPKEELESLIRQMEKGTKLVLKCSKIRRINLVAKVRYQGQLEALVDSLVRFFLVDMQAQTARDQKETLIKVRRILSAVNKLPLSNAQDISGDAFSDSTPVPREVMVVESEMCDSKEAEAVDENGKSNAEGMGEEERYLSCDFDYFDIVTESDAPGSTQPAENACWTISPQRENGQSKSKKLRRVEGLQYQSIKSKAKAENNQGMDNLISEKSYEQLLTSKKRFYGIHLHNRAVVFGKGSYGTTYKVTSKDGKMMVVKSLKQVKVRKREFQQQVEILQKLLSEHPNVIPLRAYHYNKDEILLIYDYITSGSLFSLLHGVQTKWTPLDWDSRMKISLEAAEGIPHIHSTSAMNFVHGNIKSSNVLVTTDFQGCISDFGLKYLAHRVRPPRNNGYRAPEVVEMKKLTQASDVYSFGVLLCEILTGKSPTKIPWQALQLVQCDGKWIDQVFNIDPKDPIHKEEMLQMVKVAMNCVEPEPHSRPSMVEIVKRIKEIRGLNEI